MQLYEKVFGAYIGNKPIKSGPNVMIRCPWHDDSTASLAISTDDNKQVYQCFGCGKKGTLIGAYMDLKGVGYAQALKDLDESKPVAQAKPITPPHVDTDYTEYCINTFFNTIGHEKNFSFYGKKLYELRGITYITAVACCLGYDVNKGWILPIRRYKDDNKFVGYEIRKKDFTKFENGNKCYKAKNSPSCLSLVYQPREKTKKAYVCEGFIDSYFLHQYLSEKQYKQTGKQQQIDSTILTPSMGVKSLPDLVNGLWDDFEEVIFVLDNDEAGNTTSEIIANMLHGGVFKIFSGLEVGEDFEMMYKRKLKNG